MNEDEAHRIQLTTASASELLMEEDLRRWLSHRNPPLAQRIREASESRRDLDDLLHSLRLDRDPRRTARMLTSESFTRTDSEAKGAETASIDEISAGRTVREKLSHCRRQKPHTALLSAGVVLTEARRKDLLQKLQQGVNVEPDTQPQNNNNNNNTNIMNENTLSSPSTATLTHKSFNSSAIDALLVERAEERRKFDLQEAQRRTFRPKWEHYDTMRARWKYLQPQAKQLVSSQEAIAPTSVSCTFPVKDTTVSGNLVEIHNFLVRSNLSEDSIHEAMKTRR